MRQNKEEFMARPKKVLDNSKEDNKEVTFVDEAKEDLGEVKVQKSRREQTKELLKKFIEDDTRVVKGKFRNHETPGASQRVIVKKYAEVPIFDRVMEDGKIYEIPIYVARHLNGTDITAKQVGGKINSCAFPVHGFKWEGNRDAPPSTEDGGIIVPLIQPRKWTKRYGFESLEFDVEI
jgi:hypothetical protein